MGKLSGPIHCITFDCLTVNRDYAAILEQTGLNDFERIWQYEGGQPVKKIDRRTVTRIQLTINGQKRVFYLKRHRSEFVGVRRIFAFFFHTKALTQGQMEFENICVFREKGLQTVAPVAAGQRQSRFFRMESFLITEDFFPYISLEKMLQDRREFLMGSDGNVRKRNLINEITALARKMHRSGFNHLDFNATHILLDYQSGSDRPGLALFDLQRVDRKRFFRFRWPVKSLSRLNHSLPDPPFTQTDRSHLIESYTEREENHLANRILWLWVRRKTARITRHVEKKRARRKAQRGDAL